MIPRSHFTRIADEQEVDAKTVERDYVLTHTVAAIGVQGVDQGLVFKGGTEVWTTFERKTRHKRIDPSQFGERFNKRVPQWRTRWDEEMAEHLAGESDQFETVERAVRRALRSRLTAG